MKKNNIFIDESDSSASDARIMNAISQILEKINCSFEDKQTSETNENSFSEYSFTSEFTQNNWNFHQETLNLPQNPVINQLKDLHWGYFNQYKFFEENQLNFKDIMLKESKYSKSLKNNENKVIS